MRAEPMPSTVLPALTPAEAAKRLHMSVRDLAALRRTGKGPEYLAISPRTVRYLAGDVSEWHERRAELRRAACAAS
jgi:predicted DNA-binding transcriptional regulator AlpA